MFSEIFNQFLAAFFSSCGNLSEDVNTSNFFIPTLGNYSWMGTKMIGSLDKLMEAKIVIDVQQYGGWNYLFDLAQNKT